MPGGPNAGALAAAAELGLLPGVPEAVGSTEPHTPRRAATRGLHAALFARNREATSFVPRRHRDAILLRGGRGAVQGTKRGVLELAAARPEHRLDCEVVGVQGDGRRTAASFRKTDSGQLD